MKYYLYSYMWRAATMSAPSFGTGLLAHSGGIVGLYEYVIEQPENWCLTHVAEISKDEYDRARNGGVIG